MFVVYEEMTGAKVSIFLESRNEYPHKKTVKIYVANKFSVCNINLTTK